MRKETKVRCTKYERKDIVVKKKISEKEKRNILCPEYRTGKKQPQQNWGVVA